MKKISRLFFVILFIFCQPALTFPASMPAGLSVKLYALLMGGVLVSPMENMSRVTVEIEMSDPANGDVIQTCSGVVIAPTFVLTAAHCVESKTMRSVITYDKKILPIIRSFVHPHYVKEFETNRFDAAIVEVAPNAFLKHQAILAQTDDNETSAIIAGYGRTSFTQASPHQLYKVGMAVHSMNYTLSEALLKPLRDMSGACHGDSGGPAFRATLFEPIVWAIDSRAPSKAPRYCASYEIYTKISAILDWIRSITKVSTI